MHTAQEFRNASNNLVIGCAVDVDERTVRYVYREHEGQPPVCKVAFEGISFIGGLVPAVTSLYLNGECRLGQSSELLQALQAQGELLDFSPRSMLKVPSLEGCAGLEPP